MDNFGRGLPSEARTGAETCSAVGLPESKHQNQFKITGPFLGLVAKSCVVLFQSCPWSKYLRFFYEFKSFKTGIAPHYLLTRTNPLTQNNNFLLFVKCCYLYCLYSKLRKLQSKSPCTVYFDGDNSKCTHIKNTNWAYQNRGGVAELIIMLNFSAIFTIFVSILGALKLGQSKFRASRYVRTFEAGTCTYQPQTDLITGLDVHIP
jgi:hypothetical protein